MPSVRWRVKRLHPRERDDPMTSTREQRGQKVCYYSSGCHFIKSRCPKGCRHRSSQLAAVLEVTKITTQEGLHTFTILFFIQHVFHPRDLESPSRGGPAASADSPAAVSDANQRMVVCVKSVTQLMSNCGHNNKTVTRQQNGEQQPCCRQSLSK